MTAVAIGLVSGNILWALRGSAFAQSGIVQDHPEAYAQLIEGSNRFLWIAVGCGIFALLGIIAWHLIRKKLGITFWGSAFFILLYALAVVMFMLMGFSTGMFGLMESMPGA